jgi:hypothetical protein
VWSFQETVRLNRLGNENTEKLPMINAAMNTERPISIFNPDPAAILGAAVSLKKACEEAAANDRSISLSEAYNGGDEFMRQVMHVATLFETWCSEHVDFSRISDVWPYLLEDKFGEACLEVMFATGLTKFDRTACLRVAMHLRLPVAVTVGLDVPVDLTSDNPIAASPFRRFQIRTLRLHHEDRFISQYTLGDDPDDAEYGPVFFGLYGLDEDGTAEHIADRDNYADTFSLAAKLTPGIAFPAAPTLVDSFPAN